MHSFLLRITLLLNTTGTNYPLTDSGTALPGA